MRSNPLTKLRDRGRSEEGFTLIELLVVVVILGILIGIAIPVYLNYRKSAQDKAAQSDARAAISTFEVCNSDGGYPTSVPTTGGAMTVLANGCAQTISLSTGTSIRYVADSGTPVPSYTVFTQNTGGTKVYCYKSSTGGGIRDASGAAIATATCA